MSHAANDDELEQFDVVKKRQRMETAGADEPSSANDPEALAQFELFEADVLNALLNIQEDDDRLRARELQAFEVDFMTGRVLMMGGVYFSETKAIPGDIKIGCSRRDDPHLRLRELSRHVPYPFTLIAWIPTNNPFNLERIIHRHFQQHRISVAGACTEFFTLDVATVKEYIVAAGYNKISHEQAMVDMRDDDEMASLLLSGSTGSSAFSAPTEVIEVFETC